MISCFGKRKSVLRFDWSKDRSKRKYSLRFVLLLPKQRIIVQVSSKETNRADKTLFAEAP